MLRNYFKTAFRNFSRHKLFTAINICSLSIGLTCCMLILLYVKDELSFDKFHKNAAQLYRVISTIGDEKNGGRNKLGSSASPVGPAIANEIPGVREYVRITQGDAIMKLKNDVSHESIHYCDNNFFSVFTFPLLFGNPTSALDNVNSIVLSEEMALKYFGNVDVAGKQIAVKLDSVFENFMVTAVAKSAPGNSSIHFDFILPFKQYEKHAGNRGNEWLAFNINTIVLLDRGIDPSHVEYKLNGLVNKYIGQRINEINKTTKGNLSLKLSLQNIRNIHLDGSLDASGGLDNSRPIYSYILASIAAFILIISSINFINLSIGLSLKRAREIGVRKVLGGVRRQLVTQFICEAFLLCSIAFCIGIAMAQACLPLFNQLSNKQLSLTYLINDRGTIISAASLLIITSLAAGVYPAFIVSGFKAVDVLQSKLQLTGKNIFSKSLVVLQFGIAIFLAINMMIFQSQINFLLKKDLGYEDKNVVRVVLPADEANRVGLLKNELLKNKNISQVSNNSGGLYIDGAKANGKDIATAIMRIDEDYLETLQIPILKGRNISNEFPSDAVSAILVNEAFAKESGWNDPVGKKVALGDNGSNMVTIVGMVKNYNFQSLHDKIIPLILHCGSIPQNFGTTLIKIRPADFLRTLSDIQNSFKEVFNFIPFRYVFLEQTNKAQYANELKWKETISYAAIISMIISCLGLWGLTTFSIATRTKEIGIRKVLGASAARIAALVTRDFLGLIGLAFIISVPFGWYTANKWLENFVYRVPIKGWFFLLVGGIAIAIALITISIQIIKAALANPVKSLRTG